MLPPTHVTAGAGLENPDVAYVTTLAWPPPPNALCNVVYPTFGTAAVALSILNNPNINDVVLKTVVNKRVFVAVLDPLIPRSTVEHCKRETPDASMPVTEKSLAGDVNA